MSGAERISIAGEEILLRSPRPDLLAVAPKVAAAALGRAGEGEEALRQFQTPYSRWWTGNHPKAPRNLWAGRERMKAGWGEYLERLNGQILVDLGCGADSSDFMGFVAPYQPRLYIGVDVHNPRGQGGTAPLGPGSPLKGALAAADMLEFASRLPDNSVSIALNGIDNMILEDPLYRAYLMKEVARISDPKGVVLGMEANDGILKALAARPEFIPNKFALPLHNDERNGLYFLVKEI